MKCLASDNWPAIFGTRGRSVVDAAMAAIVAMQYFARMPPAAP
jgi:hypothetical protein